MIDEEAFVFLGNFHVPTTVQGISAVWDLPMAPLLAVVLVLLDLGFLFDLDQTPVIPCEHARVSTLSAWLHITNACNLSCHYCYVSKSAEHMEQVISQRAVDAVMRSAVRHGYRGVHCIDFTLTGAGVPHQLLVPQAVRNVIVATKSGARISLRACSWSCS